MRMVWSTCANTRCYASVLFLASTILASFSSGALARVWAIRYHLPGEPAAADLYSPARGYLGTVQLGAASPVAFRSDGALISLENVTEIPAVVVYQTAKHP